MNEDILVRIALAVTLAGLLILFLLTGYIKDTDTTIMKINSDYERFKGRISSVDNESFELTEEVTTRFYLTGSNLHVGDIVEVTAYNSGRAYYPEKVIIIE